MDQRKPQSSPLPPPRASPTDSQRLPALPLIITYPLPSGTVTDISAQSLQNSGPFLGPNSGFCSTTYNRIIHLILIIFIQAMSIFNIVLAVILNIETIIPIIILIWGIVCLVLWWIRGNSEILKRKIRFIFYSLGFELLSSIWFIIFSIIWLAVLLVQEHWAVILILIILNLILVADIWRLSRVILIQACPKEQRFAYYKDVVGLEREEGIDFEGADEIYCGAILPV